MTSIHRQLKNKRERRRRIDPSETKGELVVDIEAFIENKCSANVKKIITASEHIDIDVYFDKHYSSGNNTATLMVKEME